MSRGVIGADGVRHVDLDDYYANIPPSDGRGLRRRIMNTVREGDDMGFIGWRMEDDDGWFADNAPEGDDVGKPLE